MNRRTATYSSLGLFGALAVAAVAVNFRGPDLTVHLVHRAGSASIDSLTLSVDGHSRHIESLASGASVEIAMPLAGEASMRLEYRMAGEDCLWQGGYVEPGYEPTLTVRGCGEVDED